MEYGPNEFHDFRKRMFAIYERYGLDKALQLLKSSTIPHTSKAGLQGELLFYNKYRNEFGLEALLDTGVKADFMGRKDNNQLVNFDVTTNTDYKDIHSYA